MISNSRLHNIYVFAIRLRIRCRSISPAPAQAASPGRMALLCSLEPGQNYPNHEPKTQSQSQRKSPSRSTEYSASDIIILAASISIHGVGSSPGSTTSSSARGPSLVSERNTSSSVVDLRAVATESRKGTTGIRSCRRARGLANLTRIWRKHYLSAHAK